jgi:carboxylesterase
MTKQDQSYRVGTGRKGILLIHGLSGSPMEMRFIANGLAREGHTVCCPELAGHGSRAADLGQSTWQEWYQSAEQALLDMCKEFDSVVIGGLSTGAIVCLLLAANHPEKVNGLALYSPTLWLNGRSIPWYARLFPIIPNRPLASIFRFPHPENFGIKDVRLREFLKAAVASSGCSQTVTPGTAVIERRWLVNAARQAMHKVTQPVLILHPRDDDYAALNNATFLQQNLKGTVDLVILDDSYHLVTVDRQRNLVLERTVEFARSIFGQVSAAIAPPTELNMAA